MKIPLQNPTYEDRANLLFERMQRTGGKGFRDPNPYLLELSIRAGLTKREAPERSARSLRKAVAKKAFIEAYKANPRNKMTNWQRHHPQQLALAA